MMQYYLILAQIRLADIVPSMHTFAQSVTPCQPKGSFFGFPTWYKYLPGDRVRIDALLVDEKTTTCTPRLTHINDIWLIGLAAVEILLRVIIIVAILYVILGGVKYITARGETGGAAKPDKINEAKNTVLDALLGLIIAVVATAVVSFVGRRFTQ